MLKFTIPAALALIFVASPALASHCPLDVKKIDAALADAQLSAADLAAVTALRDTGENEHNKGSHGKAIEALHQAMALLGIGH